MTYVGIGKGALSWIFGILFEQSKHIFVSLETLKQCETFINNCSFSIYNSALKLLTSVFGLHSLDHNLKNLIKLFPRAP